MTDTSQPIYVGNQRFLGRVREQQAFRAALDEICYERDQDAMPYVVLIYGDGGMGKTTLSKRLRDIALLLRGACGYGSDPYLHNAGSGFRMVSSPSAIEAIVLLSPVDSTCTITPTDLLQPTPILHSN